MRYAFWILGITLGLSIAWAHVKDIKPMRSRSLPMPKLVVLDSYSIKTKDAEAFVFHFSDGDVCKIIKFNSGNAWGDCRR